jgi:hypothetical protein
MRRGRHHRRRHRRDFDEGGDSGLFDIGGYGRIQGRRRGFFRGGGRFSGRGGGRGR